MLPARELEREWIAAAGECFGHEAAEALRSCARVEQPVAHEGDQLVDLLLDFALSCGERHTEDPLAIALERARERGRGREATAPETIPPLGWRDILWRVLEGILADRILYTSGGVAFFTLLAFFPAVATIVSIYGLVADVSTIREHLTLLVGILPDGGIELDVSLDPTTAIASPRLSSKLTPSTARTNPARPNTQRLSSNCVRKFLTESSVSLRGRRSVLGFWFAISTCVCMLSVRWSGGVMEC